MTTYEIEDRWLSRLFHIFRNSPHILGLVEILSDPLQDTIDVCDYILGHLSIDDAEGEQLDFLGELIGVYRVAAQEDSNNIFTMCSLGEVDTFANSTGFYNDDPDDPPTGGYMVSINGLSSITEPRSMMSDNEFRFLIRQKAASYRKNMTRVNLFNYLLAFGSRCLIDDESMIVSIDPIAWNDLNEWQKWCVLNKGFKPAGIKTEFVGNIRKVTL